ncbi:hypothetical protein LC048_17795 [Mesobacillus subterraneus]|uniref:hypothetical protein n=1 Tax=Mesobacillus subterraneus TaxID=285983 RepID=UPI00273CFA97|nr:hypothetical protein [Mesobacillus subterraneus]WLR54281.1 hypothetical protein LC048_17795 [Mesobacillus subterraneus]
MPPYDIGDLWANGQTVYRCKVAKASGGSYAAGDWEKIGDVTNQNTSKDTSNVNGVPANEVIGRLSTAESSITQNANEISLRVTKTTYETGISDTKGYADNAVSNVKVGVRNLLKSTTMKYNYGTLTSSSTEKIAGSGKWFIQFSINITSGKQYTVSNKAITNSSTVRPNNVNVIIYNSTNTTIKLTIGVLNSGGSITFTAPSTMVDGDNILFYVSDGNVQSDFVIQGLKLEEGNKATDWTPAPEDTQGQIDSLGSRMSTAESSITQQANQIALKVTQSDYNGTSPTNLLRKSSMNTDVWSKTSAGSSSTTYIPNAGFLSGGTYEINVTGTTASDYAYISMINGDYWIPVKDTENYTASIYSKLISGSGEISLRAYCYNDAGTYLGQAYHTPTAYSDAITGRTSGVFKPLAGTTKIYFMALLRGKNGSTVKAQLSNAMVQRGIIVTGWQPHTDEMATELQGRMSSAESSITQQATQISQKVSQTDYNGNTIASLINQTATTILLQAAKIALDGYVEAKHIKSLNGLNINDQFMVDANGNVSLAGILKAIGSSSFMQLAGNSLVAGGYDGAPVGGRTLLSVLSTIPNMFDGNYADPEVKGHGKLYTHTARIWVPAQTFNTSSWVEYTLDLTGYDSVGIQVVSAVSLQSRAKEMYAYERVDGRYPTVGDLRRIVIRLSPHYNFTSPGFFVEVGVMILGWR